MTISFLQKPFFNGISTGSTELISYGKTNLLNIKLTEKHLWDIGQGNLYDIKITVKKDGIINDLIESYAGLRTISLNNGAFLLNGKKFFGRFVLDQGYYQNGLYTASDAGMMKKDIEYAMALGFNVARLHEKVFEPYYLYQADKLGFLVWGEYGNWGFDHSKPEYTHIYLKEWIEAVKRDFNHPSVIGWCPFNETSDFDKKYPQSDELILTIYEATKEIDSTRPVIDTSGWYHIKTDIYDVHDYAQNVETLKETFSEIDSGIIKDGIYRLKGVHRQYYNNEPIFLSEYGGIKWDTNEESPSWGYGNAPESEEEFITRYKELTEYAIDNEKIAGFCYTQLYDIEQEKTGL